MGIVTDLLGTRVTMELASVGGVEAPRTTKETPEVERVEPEALELAYLTDSITFNSINKVTQAIMSAGYEVTAKEEDVRNYFNDFLDTIGKVGEDITFTELLKTIFQNQAIYGNAYIELVYNKKLTKIVDLVALDPKRIDYAKTGAQKIALDKYGKPIGYTQKIPLGVSTEGLGDPAPKEVSLGPSEIFLMPERIAHFKLYTFGDRFYGVGLIEPGYKDIIYAKNIKDAQTNSIFTRGTGPIIDYVGDQDHYPTAEQIKSTAKKLSELKYSRYFAFPYWHDIQPLEIKHSDIVNDTIRYLQESQAASLGVPLAFATGSGERTNRATLSNQQRFLEFTLRDIVNRTIASIRKYIFSRISRTQKFKEIPDIRWGYLGTEEINDKAGRLNNYVKTGILKPEEARGYAMSSENLGQNE
jgi:ribulose bisphosphate carboxylase small subunit